MRFDGSNQVALSQLLMEGTSERWPNNRVEQNRRPALRFRSRFAKLNTSGAGASPSPAAVAHPYR
jgi:hypothetical protein